MVRGKATRQRKRPSKPKLQHKGVIPQVESLKVSDVKPFEKNARMHSADQVKQIANSIANFGFVNPLLVDEQNEIIAGHGRFMAAQYLELDEVPVYRIAHLSDAKKKALRLADNKIALNSKWDTDLLAECIGELKEMGTIEGLHLPDLIGFDAREIRTITTPKDDSAKSEGYGGGEKGAEAFEVLVTCKDLTHQEDLVSLLNARGYEYKVVEK